MKSWEQFSTQNEGKLYFVDTNFIISLVEYESQISGRVLFIVEVNSDDLRLRVVSTAAALRLVDFGIGGNDKAGQQLRAIRVVIGNVNLNRELHVYASRVAVGHCAVP